MDKFRIVTQKFIHMIQAEQIEIPFSKRRVILPFLVVLALFAVCIYSLLFTTDSLPIPFVILCGLGTVFFARMLFKKHPPIIINRKGVSEATIGFVLWEDIAEFSRRFESDGQGFGRRTIPFILVVVKNPEAYIEKTTKKTLQRKKLYSNLKWYGTPLVFEARDYKMSAREILTLLNDKLERYKAWQSQNNAHS